MTASAAPATATTALSRGMFPDLRYAPRSTAPKVFKSIVIDGALTANGMVSFKSALTQEQVDSIRAYMVSRAIDAKKNGPGVDSLDSAAGVAIVAARTPRPVRRQRERRAPLRLPERASDNLTRLTESKASKFDAHCAARLRGFVDRHHDLHVAQAFLA